MRARIVFLPGPDREEVNGEGSGRPLPDADALQADLNQVHEITLGEASESFRLGCLDRRFRTTRYQVASPAYVRTGVMSSASQPEGWCLGRRRACRSSGQPELWGSWNLCRSLGFRF